MLYVVVQENRMTHDDNSIDYSYDVLGVFSSLEKARGIVDIDVMEGTALTYRYCIYCMDKDQEGYLGTYILNIDGDLEEYTSEDGSVIVYEHQKEDDVEMTKEQFIVMISELKNLEIEMFKVLDKYEDGTGEFHTNKSTLLKSLYDLWGYLYDREVSIKEGDKK